MNQPLAYIHPEAKIAPNVVIDPFVTIDKNVVIGEGTRIGSNVTILEGTRIGKNCNIFPGAVISAVPQDLKFGGEDRQIQSELVKVGQKRSSISDLKESIKKSSIQAKDISPKKIAVIKPNATLEEALKKMI